MKHSKLYTYLGITGALLVPALAVAAIEIPNVFEGGDPVSASEMNQNFEALADALEQLEEKVEKLEGAGLQAPVEAAQFPGPFTGLEVVYRAVTDGVMSVAAAGDTPRSTAVRFDLSSTEDGALNCDGSNCTPIVSRGYDGSSGSVFVPAGHYVAVKIDELTDGTLARVYWQSLRGPGGEPTLIESNYP